MCGDRKKMNKKQREAKGFCDGDEYDEIKRFKVENWFMMSSSGETGRLER